MSASKEKVSAVAEAENWRARILSELAASKRWGSEWGAIYGGDGSGDAGSAGAADAAVTMETEALLRQKRAELERLSRDSPSMTTTTRSTFRGAHTLEQFGLGESYRRKNKDLMPSTGPGLS
jgi:hypothetical protein